MTLNGGIESSINLIHSCIVCTLPERMNDVVVSSLQNKLVKELATESLRGVILDFGLVKLIDSHEINQILKLANIIKLLGYDLVFVAINPGIVSVIVDFDISLGNFKAFISVEDGIEYFN